MIFFTIKPNKLHKMIFLQLSSILITIEKYIISKLLRIWKSISK